jgi:hypothetical protein
MNITPIYILGGSRKAYIPNLKEKVLPGAVSSCKKKRIFETYPGKNLVPAFFVLSGRMTSGDPASPPTGTPDFPTGSLVLIHSVRTNPSLNGKARRWKKGCWSWYQYGGSMLLRNARLERGRPRTLIFVRLALEPAREESSHD